ncbi:MAG: YdcF family protein [Candidatus Kerfeldbacteria bacterium]|nr:YdcF family protein [Candidatus Kerfeldbacteria bacterium]
MKKETIHQLAKKIWNYHHLNQKLEKADCILVLGSYDIRVAERGAQLFLDGYAPLIIFSGGLGSLTKNIWLEPEADKFAEVALKMGVPKDRILIENKSTNTGENFLFTKKMLSERNINPKKFILVQKPYMERRAYATFRKLWPEKKCVVTSPEISFEDYPNKEIVKDDVINIMVGDLQRIKIYPQKRFQIPQEIPSEVSKAYEKLVAVGYTKHLIVGLGYLLLWVKL